VVFKGGRAEVIRLRTLKLKCRVRKVKRKGERLPKVSTIRTCSNRALKVNKRIVEIRTYKDHSITSTSNNRKRQEYLVEVV
jgi:hypothetical protein